jgi:hypothetical protein
MLIFVLSSFAYITCSKFTHKNFEVDCQLVDQLPNDKKIINFTAGGGNWIYYMGIARFLQENYDLNNVNLIGTSAGTFAATFLANKIHIDKCINKTLANDLHNMRQLYWGLLNFFCIYCIKNTQRYYNTLCKIDTNTNRLYIGVSEIDGFRIKKRYFTGGSLESMNICSYVSAWIPFITAPFFQPFCKINNRLYFDGFISGSRDYTDKENTLVIYPRVFRRKPLWKYWIWFNADYNFAEYNEGYEDAKSNKKRLDVFLGKNSPNRISQ